ncbi:MAG: hypothetical protein GEU90_10425 [Gemmatimonas sp.]|nr:hypothetical protein [Gemmatimonas sp.]
MAVFFSCPVCGVDHRSRLLALRRRYFNEVLPELGEIAELCPNTDQWVTLRFEDLRWEEDARKRAGWV